jgi:hypothetical protein
VEGEEVVLAAEGVRVRWGRPPGRERAGEARAAVKRKRLLDQQTLRGYEHNLRPADKPQRTALK